MDWRIDGQTLQPPADWVVLEEGAAGVRAELTPAAFQHGVHVGGKHFQAARLANLTVGLPGGDAYAARAHVEGLVYGGIRRLSRDDPHYGEASTRILTVETAVQGSGGNRFVWAYPIWLIDGYWQGDPRTVAVSVTTADTVTIPVAGNVATRPTVTILCTAAGSNPTVTGPDGASFTVGGSYDAGDTIVVDCDTVTATVNDVIRRSALRVNRGWILDLPAGDNTIGWSADTGTWDVTVGWRDRWR